MEREKENKITTTKQKKQQYQQQQNSRVRTGLTPTVAPLVLVLGIDEQSPLFCLYVCIVLPSPAVCHSLAKRGF